MFPDTTIMREAIRYDTDGFTSHSRETKATHEHTQRHTHARTQGRRGACTQACVEHGGTVAHAATRQTAASS